jgi:hypothetical protein
MFSCDLKKNRINISQTFHKQFANKRLLFLAHQIEELIEELI